MGYIATSSKEKFMAGIRLMVAVVGSTMGPYGKTVLECAGLGATKRRLIRDGKETLNLIQPTDPEEYEPIARAKDVAAAVVRRAGDSTSTATLILGNGYLEAEKQYADNLTVSRAGLSRAIRVVKGLVLEYLRSRVLSVVRDDGSYDMDKLRSVATVAAAGDSVIGTQIADMIGRIGADGSIKVEYHDAEHVVSEVVPGYKAEGGVYEIGQYNTRRGLEVENARVCVVTDESGISDWQKDVSPILAAAKEFHPSPLLIFCLHAEGTAKATLLNPMVQGPDGRPFRAPVWVIRIGNGGVDTLADIAAVTGAKMMGKTWGNQVSKIKSSDFGVAKHVIATTESVTIMRSEEVEGLDKYVNALRAAAEEKPERLEAVNARIAAVMGSVGVIKVPASTQSTGHYYQEVVDDTWRATQAAIKHGVLPGGGWTLYSAAEFPYDNLTEEEFIALQVVGEGLKSVAMQVYGNAGWDDRVEDAWRHMTNSSVLTMPDGLIMGCFECGVIDSAAAVMAAVELSLDELALWVGTEYLLVRKNDGQ